MATLHGKHIARLVASRYDNPTGAEIGVLFGKTSLTLLSLIPRLTLYLIDPWELSLDGGGVGKSCSQLRTARHDTQHRVAEYITNGQAILIHNTSERAAESIADAFLDFAVIDGRHDYDYVAADILRWRRTIGTGLLIGHDYRYDTPTPGKYLFPGVDQAVDEFARSEGRMVHTLPGHVWWIDMGTANG